MNYLIAFLEGIITFISPCLLPMLPIYISYFAGSSGNQSEKKKNIALKNSLGFVLGFGMIFVLMGAFAGTIGGFLREYQTTVNIVSGAVVILFGLNFMGIIRLPFVNSTRQLNMKTVKIGFFSSVLFGIIFSIGWTPCVGAFLGSALMLAAQGGGSITGIIMLLCYSLGLGIPFVASALLIEKLKTTFDFIKKHYKIINLISGGILVIIGILMATGLMGYFLSFLSF